jgi:hypothetical protein
MTFSNFAYCRGKRQDEYRQFSIDPEENTPFGAG